MSFARHQTFYLRAGWLTKAIHLLYEDTSLFSRVDAPIKLGIGKNMVHSLRFWMRAAGLAEAAPGGRGMQLSRFGKLVKQGDPYLELDLTWWLIHYHVVKNPDEATAWYYLFNEYPKEVFDRRTLTESLENYCNLVIGRSISRSSLSRDVECILATYLEPDRTQGTPEENTICPLCRLGLLHSEREGRYAKKHPISEVPLEVVFLVLKQGCLESGIGVSDSDDSKKDLRLHVGVLDLVHKVKNIGRTFNLSLDLTYRYLDALQEKGWVTFSRTAGIDTVVVEPIDPWNLVRDSYTQATEKVISDEAI